MVLYIKDHFSAVVTVLPVLLCVQYMLSLFCPIAVARLHFHFSLSCIGEGNGTPLQYSWLENLMDGGAW